MRQGLGKVAAGVAAGIAVLSSLNGCMYLGWREGGNQRSLNAFTYISTAHRPLTVTVTDVRTETPVWTIELPVGKQLSMRFEKNSKSTDDLKPYTLRYAIWPAGREYGVLDQTVPMPPEQFIRVDQTVRTIPEIPG